ncbi:HAMP domain-containing sensor histidine kinase [Neptunomonas sp.]|uniref:sensor histidine kinase n=1 Tax=Neptunomonas sp. TaxID=1971898 RepID=UPI0025FE6685|nr:HAMP domain-containing sensor histidine kinase [Neptunomonas sp.]
MRRELSLYILSLALISSFAFIVALLFFFEKGITDTAQTFILMETRVFEARYREDPNTPLPTGTSLRFFYDDFEKAPGLYQRLIDQDELEIEEFIEFEWSPHGLEEWEDSRYLVVYQHTLPDKRTLFVVADYQANLFSKEEQQEFDDIIYNILLFGGTYLLVMLIAIWLYNKRINRYTQALALWADSLLLSDLQKPRPNFHFRELNRIAEQLLSAFERIAGLIDREHQFLRHASHELRTPIAIIRANMELLQKIGVPAELAKPIKRANRANQSMQQLTETLLWLSRENETAPSLKQIRPDILLDELSEELDYLLQDKEVNVTRNYFSGLTEQALPHTPLRIVLSNLLRNAYQYTDQGEIELSVDQYRIIITNRSHVTHTDHDNSFGLGLILVQKICDRLDWTLKLKWVDQGVSVTLLIPE